MGMYDSLFVKCPNCKHMLEFQSKSGRCSLDRYSEKNLVPEVAIGLHGDIVKCDFCNKNIIVRCQIPRKVKIKLSVTTAKARYNGNFNPLKNKLRDEK